MEIYGYNKKILRVNLTNEKIAVENIDENTIKNFIGGTGFGAKYLYDEVSPGTSWDSPENRIIIGVGPLSGSIVGGTGTIAIVTKGPMTNMAVDTQANGFMGAFLKMSGFDGVIIQGKGDTWKYLYISEDEVNLRKANEYLGLDTWETEDRLKNELKEKNESLSVFSIGPSGENLVRFSALVGDHGHVASKGGIGAVFGSKKLKAIVTKRGNIKIEYWDSKKLKDASNKLYEGVMKTAVANFSKWGTQAGFVDYAKLGWLPVKNYSNENNFELDKAEKLSGQYTRATFEHRIKTCWACRIAHNRYVKLKEGIYKDKWVEEPEYESVAEFGPQILLDKPNEIFEIANLVDRLGLDANESGWMLGFIMECYEKGILKDENLSGIKANWANAEAAKDLLKLIARREGMGNLFAEGVRISAETLGGEAKNIGIYTLKGVVPRGHDHRNRWYELFDNCMSNTSTIEAQGGAFVGELMNIEEVNDKFDAVAIAKLNAKYNGWHIFENSLVICRFNTNGMYSQLLEAFNAATGLNFNLDDLLRAGKRIINLLRVFNYKNGYKPEYEKPSTRYGSIPKYGIGKGLSIMNHIDEMTKIYREEMGWDKETGVPLQKTLKDLGLDYVKL
ncbi:MAG: aldehyde ferredoxin oxidoreductase C-terminal domain-containing protein [Nitrososphaerota archaeon]